jgi:hypothetical protein
MLITLALVAGPAFLAAQQPAQTPAKPAATQDSTKAKAKPKAKPRPRTATTVRHRRAVRAAHDSTKAKPATPAQDSTKRPN